MMRLLVCCLIGVLLLIACNTKDTKQFSEQKHPITETGNWVNISNAPLDCGYLLHNNKIYGVGITASVEDIDWDLFWTEFLRSQFDTLYYRVNGKVVDFTIEDNTAHPIKYVDIPSFLVNTNEDGELYAKDKNYVYYPLDMYIFDYYDYYDISFEGDIRIPGADPKSFKYIGKGYAVDKNNMYYKGEKIKWNNYIIDALQQDDCPAILPFNYGVSE